MKMSNSSACLLSTGSQITEDDTNVSLPWTTEDDSQVTHMPRTTEDDSWVCTPQKLACNPFGSFWHDGTFPASMLGATSTSHMASPTISEASTHLYMNLLDRSDYGHVKTTRFWTDEPYDSEDEDSCSEFSSIHSDSCLMWEHRADLDQLPICSGSIDKMICVNEFSPSVPHKVLAWLQNVHPQPPHSKVCVSLSRDIYQDSELTQDVSVDFDSADDDNNVLSRAVEIIPVQSSEYTVDSEASILMKRPLVSKAIICGKFATKRKNILNKLKKIIKKFCV